MHSSLPHPSRVCRMVGFDFCKMADDGFLPLLSSGPPSSISGTTSHFAVLSSTNYFATLSLSYSIVNRAC